MKQIRKARGLSAEHIAKALGVSPATIYRYEKGDIEKVPGDLLEPLSIALGTTPQYLMGWTEDPSLPASPALAAYRITSSEYSLVLAYRKATQEDRQIIDNITARYASEKENEKIG
jgi:transcriptional regulator with XRE-family HTH domain